MAAADDETLGLSVAFPWEPQPYTLAEMAANHLWNLGYHEGQLYYLMSLE